MSAPLHLAADGSAAGITIDPVVFGELRALGGAAGPGFLADLVDQFVDETEPLLAQLRLALELGDTIGVERITHSLKGSSAQLGGRRLASSCDRLETRAIDGDVSGGLDDLQTLEVDYQELRRTLAQQLSSLGRIRPRGPRA